MGSAGLVFAVIVVGGVTRLTESGLSITEWKPIAGTIPPLNQEEWMVEFEKYKATPEFKLLVFPADLDGLEPRLKGNFIQVEPLNELGGIQEYFLHGVGSSCSWPHHRSRIRPSSGVLRCAQEINRDSPETLGGDGTSPGFPGRTWMVHG